MKVYQTALKLHSQGSNYLKEAAKAYKELFDSEIFRYKESRSEFDRGDFEGEYGSLPGYDYNTSDRNSIPTAATADNAPSTLPQVLHLSYKNRGQFHLDQLRAARQKTHASSDSEDENSRHRAILSALNDFGEALDKDDADLDLWRRSARVSQVLGSRRIARYCLEAALQGEVDDVNNVLAIPNVESTIVVDELTKLEDDLQDALSRLQHDRSNVPSVASSNSMKRQLKLYQFLEDDVAKSLYSSDSMEKRVLARRQIKLDAQDWTSLGLAVLRQITAERDGMLHPDPGEAITFAMEVLSRPSDQSLEDGAVRTLPDDDASPLLREDVFMADMEATNVAPAVPGDVESQPRAADEPSSAKDESTLKESTDGLAILPRKRSVDATDAAEPTEGVRLRSKRIRARESTAGELNTSEVQALDANSNNDEQVQTRAHYDHWLFAILNTILEKTNSETFKPAEELRSIIKPDPSSLTSDEAAHFPLSRAIKDFYDAMDTWDEGKTSLFKQSDESLGVEQYEQSQPVFLDHSGPTMKQEKSDPKLDLAFFLQSVNDNWLSAIDVAIYWICNLLRGTAQSVFDTDLASNTSSFLTTPWPDALADIVQKMIVVLDNQIYNMCFESCRIATMETDEDADEYSEIDRISMIAMIQSLFELHLDVRAEAEATSTREKATSQSRLEKWSELAMLAINTLPRDGNGQIRDKSLCIRHMWASVVLLQLGGVGDRDYIITCFQDIKAAMVLGSYPHVTLPNSSVMPELSIQAVDRALSKLQTVDFFSSIFYGGEKDPVTLIERLEPILNHSLSHPETALDKPEIDKRGQAEGNAPTHESHTLMTSNEKILIEFVENGGLSLKLSLWYKLRDAYTAIAFPTKVLIINLRCVDLIMDELKSHSYAAKSLEDRVSTLLHWLARLDDILTKSLALVTDASHLLADLDVNQLEQCTRSMIDMITLMYTVSLFDDYSQIGQKGPLLMNPFRAYPSESFHTTAIRFHDMQVKLWVLLYKIICEIMNQSPEAFEVPWQDQIDYLRHVHYMLGARRLCKTSDSYFLQFMRDEILNYQGDLDTRCSDEFAQVLYDVYDLYCFSSVMEKNDHGCEADYLDRKTALSIVGFVLDKAQKSTIKDLLKSDLGKTVEKVHTALGTARGSDAMIRNKKIFTAYMKSPINPADVYRCLQGIGHISTVTVSAEESMVASKGWYFLKGQLALARYRAQKARGSPGPVDELNAAVTFFEKEFEYSTERWETWYRLAQTYDLLLDEQVLWSAESVNVKRAELIQIQRFSIHAYIMAAAIAVRTASPSAESLRLMSELFTDFGTRIYSSCRPPYSCQAFNMDDFPARVTFRGREHGGELHVVDSFMELKIWKALHFASVLFRKAIFTRPKHWINHFMLGKCLWKMYNLESMGDVWKEDDSWLSNSKEFRIRQTRTRRIFAAYLEAVKTTPERKDPGKQEPILEPIYKVVTTLYKYVRIRQIAPYPAALALDRILRSDQKQIEVAKLPSIEPFKEVYAKDYIDPDDRHRAFKQYFLAVYEALRAADKSRWHHRLVARIAHVLKEMSDDNGEENPTLNAKNYLIDQHLYSSKTMALTVWKPEFERPGRHWIFMTRYVETIIDLLRSTDDLEGIQMLVRRLRKKQNEYWDHGRLWDDVCEAHLGMHRKHGNVWRGKEESVFKAMTQEEFHSKATRVEKWCQADATASPLLLVLRETVELKKLNSPATYMSPQIDDLIAETYAEIWERVPDAPETSLATSAMPAAAASVPAPAPPEAPERKDVMSLMNLLNVDGASDVPAPTPLAVQPAAIAQPADVEQVNKPRVRLVGRRELLKRAADAVTTKAAPAPATPAAVRTPFKLDPNVSVVIQPLSRGGAQAREGEADPAEEAEGETRDGGGQPAPPGSVRGSVHDSADDESELSDGDGGVAGEEQRRADDGGGRLLVPPLRRPIFPGLKPAFAPAGQREDAPQPEV